MKWKNDSQQKQKKVWWRGDKAELIKPLRVAEYRQSSHDAKQRYIVVAKKRMGYLTILNQKLEVVRTMLQIRTNFGSKLLVGGVRMKRGTIQS